VQCQRGSAVGRRGSVLRVGDVVGRLVWTILARLLRRSLDRLLLGPLIRLLVLDPLGPAAWFGLLQARVPFAPVVLAGVVPLSCRAIDPSCITFFFESSDAERRRSAPRPHAALNSIGAFATVRSRTRHGGRSARWN
jgi:hypothetical protein